VYPAATTDAQAIEGATLRLTARITALGWDPVSGDVDYRLTRSRNGVAVTVQMCAEESVQDDSPDAEPDVSHLAPPPLPTGDLPWDPVAEAEAFLATNPDTER
jgi:hypothetical protein